MALNNLRITVIDGGRQSGGENPIKKSGEKDEEDKKGKNSLLYKALNYNGTIKNSMKKAMSPTTFFAVQSGVGLAIQTGKQVANYYVSDIGRRNGDSNYQAIVNRQIEQVTDVMGIVGGALSGAAGGAMFGGLGAIGGAVAGAASAGINLGFRQAGRERAYAHEMFEESNRQAYNRARAGDSALTGRLR